MTPAAGPLWTVESLDHKRSLSLRARSLGEALRIAREHGFTEPATVKRAKEHARERCAHGNQDIL